MTRRGESHHGCGPINFQRSNLTFSNYRDGHFQILETKVKRAESEVKEKETSSDKEGQGCCNPGLP